MRSVGLAAVAVLMLMVGCSEDATEETEPTGSLAPTEAALAADIAFRAVPGGYEDCGDTVLTSGWPTTTMFNPEVAAGCIIDAAAAGSPAQYAYWGRDGTGGIAGTIIRVEGPGEMTFVEYTVDLEGNPVSAETPCQKLNVISFEPPGCSAN